MTDVHIPTTQEIFQMAYITNCGWEPGLFPNEDGWIHPKRKKFKTINHYDDSDRLIDEWPLEYAFWEAYESKK